MDLKVRILPISLLLLSSFNLSAAPIFTDWTSFIAGSNGSAVGDLNGITVTYTGDTRGIYQDRNDLFNNAASYLEGQSAFTPSLPIADGIETYGQTGITHTLTFSNAVLNPIIWINSLGRGDNWGPSFNQEWTFDANFTLLSSFETDIYRMIQTSSNSLLGEEGHGSIQFSGLYTSISWTSDNYEEGQAFTVGFDNAIVPATSPSSWLLVILSLWAVSLYRARHLPSITCR